MDALKYRLDDLAHQASVDPNALVDHAHTEGSRIRRRRRVVTGAATLASVAVLGTTALGATVLLSPRSTDVAPVAADGPIAGVTLVVPEGAHPLVASDAYPMRYDAASSDVTLAAGAPEKVRLDGRIASMIALSVLGEIAPGRYGVGAHSLLGTGEGDEVGDDGAVTGAGRLVEASAQLDLLEDGVPNRLSLLVQQRQGEPEGIDCTWPRGQEDCEVVPQADGSKVMAYQTVNIIDPDRPELNATRLVVDRYDPDTGLRLRIDTAPSTLGTREPYLTREQLIALATADAWAPLVPIDWYLAGQELEFVWAPSNEYDVLPDER